MVHPTQLRRVTADRGGVDDDRQTSTRWACAVGAAVRAYRSLPRGRSLEPQVWSARHRLLLVVLWAHIVPLALYGLARGNPLPHTLAELFPVAAAAAVGGRSRLPRAVRSGTVTVGLATCSALAIHLSGGLIEAHFHFFVVVGLITLYHDWIPFLLSLGYVVVHHGVIGTLAPEHVYNHPAAVESPWTWAIVHGGFIFAASATHLASWRLAEDSFDDPLTGLANRSLFATRLDHAVAAAHRTGTALTVLYLDLDDFKAVNDELGHAVGDEVLVAAAERIDSCLRRSDTLARLGGDEFVVLAPGLAPERAVALAQRILGRLDQPLAVGGRHVSIGASIGIAADDGAMSADELLRRADGAMYEAKQSGTKRYAAADDGCDGCAREPVCPGRPSSSEDLGAPVVRARLAVDAPLDLVDERGDLTVDQTEEPLGLVDDLRQLATLRREPRIRS